MLVIDQAGATAKLAKADLGDLWPRGCRSCLNEARFDEVEVIVVQLLDECFLFGVFDEFLKLPVAEIVLEQGFIASFLRIVLPLGKDGGRFREHRSAIYTSRWPFCGHIFLSKVNHGCVCFQRLGRVTWLDDENLSSTATEDWRHVNIAIVFPIISNNITVDEEWFLEHQLLLE